MRTDGHVRRTWCLRSLPARIQRWVEIGNCLVAIGFCIGLTWLGFALSQSAFDFDDRSSTGLSIPMWIYYTALPTGAG
ncbi:MAG: TRAP transporter small permease [Pseudomonadota bacterium]